MLFKTIYGPELESLFFWIQKYGPVSQEKLSNSFGALCNDKDSSSTNLKDALSFLETAGLVYTEEKKSNTNYISITGENFLTTLIKNIREIQLQNKANHILDPYYFETIDKLFIRDDISFRCNLHTEFNNLDLPEPCSKEKVNAWKRVLEYMELGNRGYSGFMLNYSTSLIRKIIFEWTEVEAPIQQFLEGHFNKYLPWENKYGDLYIGLGNCLLFLEELGEIKLLSKQDLPTKNYFKNRKINWITKEENYAVTLS